MSSYFDGAAAAFDSRHSDMARLQLRDEVKERVKAYLDWIEENCLKAEKDKVPPLRATFERITNNPATWDKDGHWMVSKLHDLGHDIGTARIRIRGGLIAGDSPYFPGHYEKPGP